MTAADDREVALAAGDPIDLCAQLWSVCARRPYEGEATAHDPDFVAFLEQSGMDTPQITPLFDVEYYAHQVSWQTPPINFVLHYCGNWPAADLRPHVIFDNAYLLAQTGISRFVRPPLLHLLEAGDPKLSPHPLFDPRYYAEAVGEDFLAGDLPIIAFVERWAAKPAPFSPFFSTDFYGLHEPAVRFGSLNPLIHFLSTPQDRRRDPNPMLHRSWYRALVEDELGDAEPLAHYVVHGLARGLMPNPFASGELRASSLGLPALIEALRRYIAFPDESARAA